MTVVQMLIGRTRSAMRKAAVILAATQVMLGTAPLFESGARNASAHIEASGVQLHHAHDDSNCIACASHRLLSGAEASRSSTFAAPVVDTAAPRTESGLSLHLARGASRSRAPPAFLV